MVSQLQQNRRQCPPSNSLAGDRGAFAWEVQKDRQSENTAFETSSDESGVDDSSCQSDEGLSLKSEKGDAFPRLGLQPAIISSKRTSTPTLVASEDVALLTGAKCHPTTNNDPEEDDDIQSQAEEEHDTNEQEATVEQAKGSDVHAMGSGKETREQQKDLMDSSRMKYSRQRSFDSVKVSFSSYDNLDRAILMQQDTEVTAIQLCIPEMNKTVAGEDPICVPKTKPPRGSNLGRKHSRRHSIDNIASDCNQEGVTHNADQTMMVGGIPHGPFLSFSRRHSMNGTRASVTSEMQSMHKRDKPRDKSQDRRDNGSIRGARSLFSRRHSISYTDSSLADEIVPCREQENRSNHDPISKLPVDSESGSRGPMSFFGRRHPMTQAHVFMTNPVNSTGKSKRDDKKVLVQDNSNSVRGGRSIFGRRHSMTSTTNQQRERKKQEVPCTRSALINLPTLPKPCTLSNDDWLLACISIEHPSKDNSVFSIETGNNPPKAKSTPQKELGPTKPRLRRESSVIPPDSSYVYTPRSSSFAYKLVDSLHTSTQSSTLSDSVSHYGLAPNRDESFARNSLCAGSSTPLTVQDRVSVEDLLPTVAEMTAAKDANDLASSVVRHCPRRRSSKDFTAAYLAEKGTHSMAAIASSSVITGSRAGGSADNLSVSCHSTSSTRSSSTSMRGGRRGARRISSGVIPRRSFRSSSSHARSVDAAAYVTMKQSEDDSESSFGVP